MPIVSPGQGVSEVQSLLCGSPFESASHIVVCTGRKFEGVITIEDFLAAPPESTVDSLIDREAPVVGPGVDQEIAAWTAVQRGESALAVIDSNGQFAGLIPPHRLVAVLLSEHEEDLSRLGGFTKGAWAARSSSEEPVRRRFVHRLPWLLVGLLGAIISADIVAWFDSHLEQKVVLAFFIPAVVYIADAVGTQTETVVVRGLSIGVALRKMIVRELLAGLVIGIAIAVIAWPIIYFRWEDAPLAWSVAVSFFAACSTATFIAMLLPWLFDRIGVDPAFGSGPLATVIQDLLSVWIYFSIAVTIIS